ncbi:hypothetical protein [Psychromonas arctica]|uniref:hypothetical protein n=1 Tax=Psychromonas arctica TaxID=168275 RepID=UPI00041562C7|nr:hypothetical protein [Psychromonas arctica]
MEFSVPEILEKNTFTFAFALAFALIGVSIKVVTGLISFYEEVLIKRYFKRLNSLKEHVTESSEVCDYLVKLKDNEVFRLASGIKSSPEKNDMFMKLYLLGIADNRELKRIRRYLKPEGEKIYIDVDWEDKLQFLYSLVAALFLMITGVILGGYSFVNGTSADSITGLIIMTMFVITAAIVGSDFRTHNTLKRIRLSLLKKGLIANEEAKIMWSFP